MQSQRRELIRQLDVLLFVLFIYTWFLDKSLILLALKIGLQVQYCNPSSFNPDLPLPILCRTVLFFNLAPIVSHAFFWTGKGQGPLDVDDDRTLGGAYSRSGRTGFVLDFVGQEYQPSRFHLLLIDLLTTYLQWLFIIVSSETEKAEELRPDLDEYGLLDGSPTEEIILLEPEQPRPYVRRPSAKQPSPGRRRNRQSDRTEGGDLREEDEDGLSDAGSDAPLRPHEQGPSSSLNEGLGDDPAHYERSEARARKRKGRRRDSGSGSDVNAEGMAGPPEGRNSLHGQGWSPRDEEASLFLPTLNSSSSQTRSQRRRTNRDPTPLAERTALTHPIAHLPLAKLIRNTFTFVPVTNPRAAQGSGSAQPSASANGTDNRPPSSPVLGQGASREGGINVRGARGAGRLLGAGAQFGIVPMFRRYREGEAAVVAPSTSSAVPSGSNAAGTTPARADGQASASSAAASRGSQDARPGTIPVIALPFTTPFVRISDYDAGTEERRAVDGHGDGHGGSGQAPHAGGAAVPTSAAQATGRGPGTGPPRSPGQEAEENSWAWVIRNVSLRAVRR